MLTLELPEAPEKLYYSAGDAHPLDKLESDKIVQMVIDRILPTLIVSIMSPVGWG